MRKEIIAETEHVVAIEQDLDSEIVFVTFNEMGFVRNDLRFWGDGFFQKLGISAIGFVTPGPNWYPRASMQALLDPVREKIRGRKVVTYGHSQGAYGALKYARQLNAAIALALCPQWSIDPSDVGSFDSRFASYFDADLQNGTRVEQQDVCANSFVFFDNMEPLDAANAERLTALSGVRAVSAPCTMHDTIRLLTESQNAAKLVEFCRGDVAPSVTQLRALLRESRRLSTTYRNHLLRQLLLRLNRSQRRSTTFLTRAIGASQTMNPFFRALVSFARGEYDAAQAELQTVTANTFEGQTPMVLWELTRGLGFVAAELVLARDICQRYANDTLLCLHAVNSFVRAGSLEQAQRELTRLANQQDALNHTGHIIDFSLRLKLPDVVENLLSDSIQGPRRIAILFRQIEFYEQLGDRPTAFRKLMTLSQACQQSPKNLRKVSDLLIRIGESTLALEIRQRLSRLAPGDTSLALDVIEALIPSNKTAALSRLNDIVRLPTLPASFLERASILYQSLEMPEAALKSIKTAVARPGANIETHHRFALLLAHSGRTRQARAELAAVLSNAEPQLHQLHMLGELALQLSDYPLALRFAEAQFRRDPRNPGCILFLARYTRFAGDRARARVLLSALYDVERRSPLLSNEQWATLAQELYDVYDLALARAAALEVLARQPHHPEARELLAATELVERHGVSLETVSAPDRNLPKQQTVAGSWIARIWGR